MRGKKPRIPFGRHKRERKLTKWEFLFFFMLPAISLNGFSSCFWLKMCTGVIKKEMNSCSEMSKKKKKLIIYSEDFRKKQKQNKKTEAVIMNEWAIKSQCPVLVRQVISSQITHPDVAPPQPHRISRPCLAAHRCSSLVTLPSELLHAWISRIIFHPGS